MLPKGVNGGPTSLGRAKVLVFLLVSMVSWWHLSGSMQQQLPPSVLDDEDLNAPTTADPSILPLGRKRFEPSSSPTTCCVYDHRIDLAAKFRNEYENERERGVLGEGGSRWTKDAYAAWRAFANTTEGQRLTRVGTEDCEARWNQLVLYDAPFWHFQKILEEVMQWGFTRMTHYVVDKPGLPRILFLGDSISTGIGYEFQQFYGFRNKVNIHTGPKNYALLDTYSERLEQWLGICPWDLVQINFGMNFQPDPVTGFEPYREGLGNIFRQIRGHSPEAHLVFALTTPSPLDNAEGSMPQRETCPTYDLFKPPGTVDLMNMIASDVCWKTNVTISDRYNAILPELRSLQVYCDDHFYAEGLRVLAESDWKVVSKLLRLEEEA